MTNHPLPLLALGRFRTVRGSSPAVARLRFPMLTITFLLGRLWGYFRQAIAQRPSRTCPDMATDSHPPLKAGTATLPGL